MLLVPFQLASTLSSLASSSFKIKWLSSPTLQDAKTVLIYTLIEVITLISIVYTCLTTAEEKGKTAAMITGTFTIILFYLLPKFFLPWGIQQTCKDCEPIGKFSVGVTSLLGIVVIERIVRYAFTYR